MFPRHTFTEMILREALVETDDPERFKINYWIMQEHFPEWVETCVLQDLNDIEQWAYLEGLMAYTILPNGLLEWKPTGRL